MYKKRIQGNIILKAVLWIYAFISVYPLLWMVFYSLKNNDEIFVTNPFGFPTNFRIENYVFAWKQFNIPLYFTNSLVVTVISTIGIVALAVAFSYSIARMEWGLKNAAKNYMVIGMFVPLQVGLIPLAVLVRDLHLSNTYFALILPYIAFGLPFSILVFYGFLRTLPFELEESAFMDGANAYGTFFRIILPIMKPAIATVMIFQFLSNWNEFTLAYLLVSEKTLKTLPLGLMFFQGEYSTNWGGMGAVMTIASIPTVLIYLLFSEQIENALTVGSAVKG